MSQIKVYFSAKLEHAAKLAALQVDGFHINSRWIDTAESGRQKLKPVSHWQQENFDDIEMAHFFILYVEPADHLKGSILEIGHAIRAGKKCWIAGNAVHQGDGEYSGMVEYHPPEAANSILIPNKDIMPWAMYRQSIKIVPNLEEAFKSISRYVQQARVVNSDGSSKEPEQF